MFLLWGFISTSTYGHLEDCIKERLIGRIKPLSFGNKVFNLSLFLAFVIPAVCLFLSALARWMTGAMAHHFLFRFLIGFAIMIYVLYVPGWILSALEGSVLDADRVKGILIAIDSAGGLLMILGYLLLAGITALLSSVIIGPFIIGIFGIVLLILSPTVRDFINSYGEEVILIAMLYALGSQAWALAPSDDGAYDNYIIPKYLCRMHDCIRHFKFIKTPFTSGQDLCYDNHIYDALEDLPCLILFELPVLFPKSGWQM